LKHVPVKLRKHAVDLIAAGLPCPPFSIAGKQLGENDERNLFPAALGLIKQIRPRAVMIENVRGILDPDFASFRDAVEKELVAVGYKPLGWQLLNASNFGVPQLRPRVVFVALRTPYAKAFRWPERNGVEARGVGETIYELIASSGWPGAEKWKLKAHSIAPTIVGGSHKHGGPDLGPTRAKREWKKMGVDGLGIADAPPGPDFDHDGHPKLTVQMVALLQGFPPNWKFAGKKTASYRQVGNAFPPPVAAAVAKEIYRCLTLKNSTRR
jgi:DNA (cytosine-5)-methyltransferase 1